MTGILMDKMESAFRVYKDIEFAVMMTRDQNEVHVSFEAYEIIAWFQAQEEGDEDKLFFHKRGANSNADMVESIEESEPYLSGDIKWDGCSNMQFDEQERVMLHFCGKKAAMNIGILMGYIYEMAAQMMPEWDENLAS